MHIELVGCTSAGKTTLTRKIVDMGKSRGIEVILGDDFVLDRLRLMWIKSEFFRRRILEFFSVYVCLRHVQKYRKFLSYALGIIREAPGSTLYKINLARVVFRKVGIYEIVRRFNSGNQLVIVDNEGIVQAAHILFVHTEGEEAGDLTNFARLAPLPDMVAYLRTPVSVLLDRTLKRGHPRIRESSQQNIEKFIRQAADTFETLHAQPQIMERLFVIDSHNQSVKKLASRNGQVFDQACDLMHSSIIDAYSQSEQERMTIQSPPALESLELINQLCALLDARGIRYSHWKSNIQIDKSLEGEEDLDFFVDQKTEPEMMKALADLDFKPAKIKFGPEPSCVTHHYGLDPITGKLVHVHLFSALLTGESFVKSHRLPFDEMLLTDCDRVGPVAMVSKSAELIIFTLRTFIKYGSLPDIQRLVRKPESVREELMWLLDNGADVDKSLALLETYCPAIDEPLFLGCIQAIKDNHSLRKRIRLARKVRRRLRPYAEYSFFTRLFAYGQLFWAQVRRRLNGKIRNKTLRSGGVVIAIVGADATGKSTMVSETKKWLGKVFAVRQVHVGKPPGTLLTSPINLILPLASKLLPRLRHSQVKASRDAGAPAKKSTSLLYAFRAVSLAWDRRRLLQKVMRARAQGDIIICDRFPTETTGAMDSPRLEERTNKSGLNASLFNALVRRERKLYETMPAPDIVLKLTVSLEVAKQRNASRGEQDAEDYLEARHRNKKEWVKDGTRFAHTIDTDLPLADTILNVKKAVWESL